MFLQDSFRNLRKRNMYWQHSIIVLPEKVVLMLAWSSSYNQRSLRLCTSGGRLEDQAISGDPRNALEVLPLFWSERASNSATCANKWNGNVDRPSTSLGWRWWFPNRRRSIQRVRSVRKHCEAGEKSTTTCLSFSGLLTTLRYSSRSVASGTGGGGHILLASLIEYRWRVTNSRCYCTQWNQEYSVSVMYCIAEPVGIVSGNKLILLSSVERHRNPIASSTSFHYYLVVASTSFGHSSSGSASGKAFFCSGSDAKLSNRWNSNWKCIGKMLNKE